MHAYHHPAENDYNETRLQWSRYVPVSSLDYRTSSSYTVSWMKDFVDFSLLADT